MPRRRAGSTSSPPRSSRAAAAPFASAAALLAAFVGAAGAGFAAAAARDVAVEVPSAESACTLEGWAVDRDPRGLNVRAGPSAQARVLGTLPPLSIGEDRADFGVPFRITASRGGWLRIEGAQDDPSRSGEPARPTYAGSGWVSGRLVRFKVQSGHGYRAPDAASERIVDLGDDALTDLAALHGVLACSGAWALVEFVQEKRRDPATQALRDETDRSPQRAWFRGICANQETSCDSVGD